MTARPQPTPVEITEEGCGERRLDCRYQTKCCIQADASPRYMEPKELRSRDAYRRKKGSRGRAPTGWIAFSCRECRAYKSMTERQKMSDQDGLLLLAADVCKLAHQDLSYGRTTVNEREAARAYLGALQKMYG